MTLTELASTNEIQRSLLGLLIFDEPRYKENIERGLPFFTEMELNKIEDKYKIKGLTFKQADKILAKIGMIVKAPTFKRYVGLGLVSGTKRIERTDRGNLGYYPVTVIREVNLVKYCLFIDSNLSELLKSSIHAFESNVVEFVEARSKDAFDILANISDLGLSKRAVGPCLEELMIEKAISSQEKKKILAAAECFEDACQNVWDSHDVLYQTMADVKVPGAVALKNIFGEKPVNGDN